jgi:hypothetical protein
VDVLELPARARRIGSPARLLAWDSDGLASADNFVAEPRRAPQPSYGRVTTALGNGT